MNNSNAVAVVTGAGSGIGRAVAQALLGDGYRVALLGRRTEPLLQSAADHPRALVLQANVSDQGDVTRAFDAVVDEWGRIDVLFNNAGITGASSSLEDVEVDDWEAVLRTNLTGAMLCAQAAFKAMKAQDPQGGRIINNGSLSAHVPRPHSYSYTATKHAITGLTKSIELDGREYGISCGQIDIGNAETRLVDNFAAQSGALQANGTRVMEPSFPVDEVGEAVLFMANRGPRTTVPSMMILARGMPFVGRG